MGVLESRGVLLFLHRSPVQHNGISRGAKNASVQPYKERGDAFFWTTE